MTRYLLRLCEDRCAPGMRTDPLPPCPRVLYVREGHITLTSDGHKQEVATNQAWYGTEACTYAAGVDGATVLRYELVPEPAPPPAAGDRPEEAATRLLLAQPVELDPAQAWLIRCDRVDFAPGAVALPHGHRGGGIRCLIAGELRVQVGDQPARVMRPGDAWYESGREPVRADASPTAPTSFIRVALLPAEIRGQPSIWYVDPAAARVTPRQYTVFVDEPLALPG